MFFEPAYRTRALRTLTVVMLLGTGCATEESADDTSNGNAIQGGKGTSSGKPSFDEDDREPPLKPASQGFADAGSASSASKPAPPVIAGESSTSSAPQPIAAAVNPFVDANKDPFSTFGADVDTASYDYLRQGLQRGVLPGPEYVRVEDYINFFKYDYPKPAADAAQPFAIALAAAPHPLGRASTLVRVGIQAKAAPAFEKKPTNLVFLVDTSGSMASPEKLPLVQQVLLESLKVLAPTDKVSIVSYAGDTKVRLPPTTVSSAASITPVISGLVAGGGTAGASGINLAYEQASAGFVQGGINHVILCTDGDFNIGVSSNDALVQLIKDKRKTGVTLTALGFGRDNLNDAMMEAVSNAGNGSYSLVYNQDQAVSYANQRLLSTIEHVAKDVKIQVEFNPALVLAYRLLGYEDRAVADVSFRDDKVDGGEIGAEHRVTALYEVVLAGGTVPTGAGVPPLSVGEASDVAREVMAGELVRVKVRSKPVTATDADPASEVAVGLTPADIVSTPNLDLEWAAAIASFAEILRKSPYVGASELAAVERIVNAQKDRDGDRAELVDLLAQAKALLGQ